MRDPVKLLRRTGMEQGRCQAVILGVLERFPAVDFEVGGAGAHWVARGFVRSPRFAPKIPRRGASFAITLSQAEGATCIELSYEYTRELRAWELRIGGLVAFFAMAPLPFLLLAVPQRNLPLLFAIGAVSGSALLLLGLLEQGKAVVTSRLTSLERKLWSALEGEGPTGLIRSEDPASMADLARDILVASALLAGLLLGLWGLDFRLFAECVTAFVLAPFLLTLAAGTLAEKLPLRYRWRTRRIYISVTWFCAMFLPLPWVLGATSRAALSFQVLADVITWFGPFLVLGGELLILESILKSLRSMEVRYGGLLLNPTRGYEEVHADPEILALFQVTVLSLFLLLSVGTYTCGLIFGQWWHSRPDVAVSGVVVLFGPLFVTVVAWLARNARRGVMRLRLGSIKGQGEDLLDMVVRPGLGAEIRAALGGREIAVAWGAGIGFGSALMRCGVRRRRYLLLLDRVMLSVVRDIRQREAMIWHEVAHSFSLNRFSPLFEVVFGVWGEQVRTLALDSVREEIACDAYATDVRGLGRELLAALEALDHSGTAERKRSPEGLATALRGFFRLVTGEEQLDDLHPHFAMRMKELRRRLAEGAQNA